MSSDQSFVEFIADQMRTAGTITYRKMFGDYALYCNGKVIGLVCDNQLFIKPTEKGRDYIGRVIEAAPYPGARPHYLIESEFEDQEWVSDLVKITAESLPMPKKRKSRTIRNKK